MISIFRKLIPGALALGLAAMMLASPTPALAETGFPCDYKITSPAPLTVQVVLGPCRIPSPLPSEVMVLLLTDVSPDMTNSTTVFDRLMSVSDAQAGVFATFTFSHAAAQLEFYGEVNSPESDLKIGGSLVGVKVQGGAMSPKPTAKPIVKPTTAKPTLEPTVEQTAEPTVDPTAEPTVDPTAEPTMELTAATSDTPAMAPVSATSPNDNQDSSLVALIGLGLIILLLLLRRLLKDKEPPIDSDPPLDFYGFGGKRKN